MADASSNTTPPPKTYNGNCHCAAVRFTVTHPSLEEGSTVSSCNCSICTRNGYLFIYPPKKDVVFTDGSDAKLTAYHFGNEKIAHNFCPTCGTSVTAVHPDHDMIAVNVRTLFDVDVDNLVISKFTKGKELLPPYSIN